MGCIDEVIVWEAIFTSQLLNSNGDYTLGGTTVRMGAFALESKAAIFDAVERLRVGNNKFTRANPKFQEKQPRSRLLCIGEIK